MSIQRDLLIGKQAEQRLVALLESNKYTCDIVNKYEYDILAVKKKVEITFEVKNDIMAAKTGNIAIEYYNSRSNKASGITGTKADFWVHITSEIFIIETKKLKTLLKKHKPKRVIKNGGDGNANLYLYSINFLEEHFNAIEQMSKKAIDKFLLKGRL